MELNAGSWIEMAYDSVNREEFEDKVKNYYKGQKNNRNFWNKAQLERVLRILEDKSTSKRNPADYYFKRSYEIHRDGDERHIIVKRKKESDNIIYIVPMEEFYPKLLEAHIQTNHGGRDKMIQHLKNKYRIPRSACELFISSCEICSIKKIAPKKTVDVKPETFNGFNAIGQVDLIDFQSCPDGEYNWILNYQDHATKFLHLRPLKSNQIVEIAEELYKIFATFGAPCILQSDSGKEFASAIIKEISSIWPLCKIVLAKARYLLTDGNVENTNAEIEIMLRSWMCDNASTNWSRGCYEIQWEKNISKHVIINRSPYEALMGPVIAGLNSLPLPEDILNTLETEEDLEQLLSQHTETEITEEGLSEHQLDIFANQTEIVDKIETFPEPQISELNIDDCITLTVPNVDRDLLDFDTIFGVITDCKNDLYQIGTRDGLIRGWFPKDDIKISGTTMTSKNVNRKKFITLRVALARQRKLNMERMNALVSNLQSSDIIDQ